MAEFNVPEAREKFLKAQVKTLEEKLEKANESAGIAIAIKLDYARIKSENSYLEKRISFLEDKHKKELEKLISDRSQAESVRLERLILRHAAQVDKLESKIKKQRAQMSKLRDKERKDKILKRDIDRVWAW